MNLVGVTKKKILVEIEKSPSHGYKLALSLNLPLSTVYGHLKDLKQLGLIECNGGSKQNIYGLTDKGRLILRAIK